MTPKPRLLVQFGPPRSGTTVQFQTLCVVLHLLYAKTSTVECVGSNTTRRLSSSLRLPAGVAAVFKTHMQPPSRLGQPAWLFATARSGADAQKLQQAHPEGGALPLKYVQLSSTLARRGYAIADSYQHAFGLSDEQVRALLAYMEQWDALRLCCGAQMSESYRALLQHRPSSSRTPSTVGAACAARNLDEAGAPVSKRRAGPGVPRSSSTGGGAIARRGPRVRAQVEAALLRTSVYRSYAHRSATLRRASTLDGDFDGTYCRRANARIVEQPC